MMNDHQPAYSKGADTLDRTELAAIYDEYQPLMYRYIYRQVGQVDTARDLTADLFRCLLQAVQNGRGPDQNVRAWLYRAAHNTVVDHYRYQRYRQHLPLDDEPPSSSGNPERLVEHQLSAATVRAAVQQLTPDQQQVISLKFLEGLSNQETAAALDKPVGAVKSLQHRALATLHRLLAPEKEEVLP